MAGINLTAEQVFAINAALFLSGRGEKNAEIAF